MRQLAAVSSSEVGIRPCFYWLESPAMSDEDRMFAEANARWLKSDCQVRRQAQAAACLHAASEARAPALRGGAWVESVLLLLLLLLRAACCCRACVQLAGGGSWQAKPLRGTAHGPSHVLLHAAPRPRPPTHPPARPQDDAVVIEHFGGLPHQTFAGVFDGHGPYGRSAAKYASTHLPQLLAAKAAAAASERKRLRALREAFLEVHAAMQDAGAVGFDASLSGTTACCALLVGRRVLVASSGDSRAVVARHGAGGELEVVPLTWDAKPSLPQEESRILMAGAPPRAGGERLQGQPRSAAAAAVGLVACRGLVFVVL